MILMFPLDGGIIFRYALYLQTYGKSERLITRDQRAHQIIFHMKSMKLSIHLRFVVESYLHEHEDYLNCMESYQLNKHLLVND
jgi:hypothetical protein